MPELPDIEVYLEALRPRILGQPLEGARLGSPFLLRTVEPPLASLTGRRVAGLRRMGKAALAAYDPGGLEVLDSDLGAFQWTLVSESHTLKRALTDPHLLSGIGNSYSDEILHRARLSPFKLTRSLTPEETATLLRAEARKRGVI